MKFGRIIRVQAVCGGFGGDCGTPISGECCGVVVHEGEHVVGTNSVFLRVHFKVVLLARTDLREFDCHVRVSVWARLLVLLPKCVKELMDGSAERVAAGRLKIQPL